MSLTRLYSPHTMPRRYWHPRLFLKIPYDTRDVDHTRTSTTPTYPTRQSFLSVYNSPFLVLGGPWVLQFNLGRSCLTEPELLRLPSTDHPYSHRCSDLPGHSCFTRVSSQCCRSSTLVRSTGTVWKSHVTDDEARRKVLNTCKENNS